MLICGGIAKYKAKLGCFVLAQRSEDAYVTQEAKTALTRLDRALQNDK